MVNLISVVSLASVLNFCLSTPMARRRASSAPQANLDSLLDTLTNVVGILIIVLIVVQLNMGSATRRILANLAPVSDEQWKNTLATLAEAEAQVARLNNPSSEKVDVEALAQKMAKRVPELEKLLVEAEQESRKSAELEKRLAELRALLEKIEGNLSPVQGRLAEIQTKIDATKPAEAVEKPQPKIIRLPNPRDPPEGSVERRIVLFGGRVFIPDSDALIQAVENAVKLVISKFPSASAKGRFDRVKSLPALKDFRWQNADYSATLHPNSSGGIMLRLEPKPGRGHDIESLAQSNSPIRQVFADARLRSQYLRFYVTKDSFASYIRLRGLADDGRIPVGWEFADDKGAVNYMLKSLRLEPDPDWKPGPPSSGPNPKRDTLD